MSKEYSSTTKRQNTHPFLKESAQFCSICNMWQFICQIDIYKVVIINIFFILINYCLIQLHQVQYNTCSMYLILFHHIEITLL